MREDLVIHSLACVFREEHFIRVEEMRNSYTILVWKSKEKRHLGKPRHRWEDNIKVDLVDCKCMEWNSCSSG